MRQSRLPQVIVAVVLSFILCQSSCLAGLMTVGGSSMAPTIKDGQKVWVSDYADKANPERGDIIAFKDGNLVNIKRVVGLPKEKVIIQEGFVYIATQSNAKGDRLPEPYLAPGTVTGPDGVQIVPDGQYFVLGDNRGHSRDSRQIGCIARKNITGEVIKIY